MPYCSRCLTEYIIGTSRCEDCDIRLLPGPPPDEPEADDETAEIRNGSGIEAIGGLIRSLFGAGPENRQPPVRMLPVRIFSGPTAVLYAGLARNLLRTRGIPSFISGESSAEVLPVFEVPLLVREEDAEWAAGILRSYFDRAGLERVK